MTKILIAFFASLTIGYSPMTDPEPAPNICDLGFDGQVDSYGAGWLCLDCGGPGEPPCTAAGKEGWLCCGSSGICVAVPTYGDCDTGLVGWCSNYSTETTRKGIEIATCED